MKELKSIQDILGDMEHYNYHTENEELIRELDKEFEVLLTMGLPQDGRTEGFDILIFDSRAKDEIAQKVTEIEKRIRV